MTTYIEAISINWPTVQCHAEGDGNVYENIVWDSGSPLPSKEEIDAWILAHPGGTQYLELTRYQFRKLFTMTERVAVDASPTNTAIPANYRAMLYTMLKDLELSGVVQLDNPDTIAGVNFLAQLGLVTPARAIDILANRPPV